MNQTHFACPDGILRLGYVRTYYPAFYHDGLYRFRGYYLDYWQTALPHLGCSSIEIVLADRYANVSVPPFDGSLGYIDRKEIFTDVSTDDMDNLQWPYFRTLQPIEFDYLDFYQAIPHNYAYNWQPLDHFVVLSPLTCVLCVSAYTIVTLLTHISKIIGAGKFSVIRDICSFIFMISFTVLFFAYSAGFQQNTIARKMPEPLNFGAVRQQLESGGMEWIAAEASEVQVINSNMWKVSKTDAPWLEEHPLYIEPDFRKKISRVCQKSGSSVVSFFRSEWPEIYKIEDIMDSCSLNRVQLAPPGSYVDVVGISEVPFPYFFILHRETPRKQFDTLNQILLRIYSAEFRSGFLIRRYLTKLPQSDSPYGETPQSPAQDVSFIALSANRLLLLFFIFIAAIAVSLVVFIIELTCLPRLRRIVPPLKPKKTVLLGLLP